MKPVCDHGSWCMKDKAALYLGQDHHISYPPHRNSNNWNPPGWATVRSAWNGMCSYTGSAYDNHAVCHVPASSHSWQLHECEYNVSANSQTSS